LSEEVRGVEDHLVFAAQLVDQALLKAHLGRSQKSWWFQARQLNIVDGFMANRLGNGNMLRLLNLLDDYNR
jgi:hypothetical protein